MKKLLVFVAILTLALPTLLQAASAEEETARFLLTDNGRPCGLLFNEQPGGKPIAATEGAKAKALQLSRKKSGACVRLNQAHELAEGLGFREIKVLSKTVVSDEYVGWSADELLMGTVEYDGTAAYHRFAEVGDVVAVLRVDGGTVDVVRTLWGAEYELALVPGPYSEPVPPTPVSTPKPTPAPTEDPVPPKQEEELKEFVSGGTGTPAPATGATPAPTEDVVPENQSNELEAFRAGTSEGTEASNEVKVSNETSEEAGTPNPGEDEVVIDLGDW